MIEKSESGEDTNFELGFAFYWTRTEHVLYCQRYLSIHVHFSARDQICSLQLSVSSYLL